MSHVEHMYGYCYFIEGTKQRNVWGQSLISIALAICISGPEKSMCVCVLTIVAALQLATEGHEWYLETYDPRFPAQYHVSSLLCMYILLHLQVVTQLNHLNN